MKSSRLLPIVALLAAPMLAHAEDAAPAAAPAAAVSKIPLPSLQDVLPESEKRVSLYGWLEVGGTLNPQDPSDKQNFGRLFDDRSNEVLPNQLVMTAERALAPEKGAWDWGFKVQGMYGSDARFIHSLGLGDHYGSQIAQMDLVEGYFSLHAPILTEGGVDIKAGKFVTLSGYETIDPRANFFYSHNYIFNFAIPFNHTGILTTTHVNENLDVMAGVVRGVNTSFDDNNSSVSFHGGVTLLNLLGGKFTSTEVVHVGPENIDNNHDLVWMTTSVNVFKITDALTSITELNYTENRGADAKCYGIAQTMTYTLSDQLSVGVRGEIFRDQDGFFVAQFAANDDVMNFANNEGPIDPRTVGGGKTTYGAVTLGLNWKADPRLTIRPEVRYDKAFNSKPFNDSSASHQFTFGVDAIFTF